MKNAEDEAFDDLAKKQGSWGGGFPAKRAMAADKLQKPLTDEEIEHLLETRVGTPSLRYPIGKSDWMQFARAIEAKLKEKNT